MRQFVFHAFLFLASVPISPAAQGKDVKFDVGSTSVALEFIEPLSASISCSLPNQIHYTLRSRDNGQIQERGENEALAECPTNAPKYFLYFRDSRGVFKVELASRKVWAGRLGMITEYSVISATYGESSAQH
jgi:hypothetical protein